MLSNYHIGRFVLVSLCVGDLVRLGLSSIRVHEVKELQKTAILGTAHILRKVLM